MKRALATVLAAVVALFCMGATCNKQIIADLKNCEKAAAAKDLPDLALAAGEILAQQGLNPVIDAQLIGIGVKYGYDAIDCAVVAAVAQLKLRAASASSSQPAQFRKMLASKSDDDINRAIKRGEAWLASRGQSTRTVGPTL